MKSGMNEARKNVLAKFAKTSGSLSYSLKSKSPCILTKKFYDKHFQGGEGGEKLAERQRKK